MLYNVSKGAASHLVMALEPVGIYGHFVKAVNHCGGGGDGEGEAWVSRASSRWRQVTGVAAQEGGESLIYKLFFIRSKRRHMTSIAFSQMGGG